MNGNPLGSGGRQAKGFERAYGDEAERVGYTVGVKIAIELSAPQETRLRERAKALGISGYIVKATTIPSEVVSEIQQILKESLQ